MASSSQHSPVSRIQTLYERSPGMFSETLRKAAQGGLGGVTVFIGRQGIDSKVPASD